MQIGNVLGFAFRKVAAHGLYLAIPRRGKTPQRVIAFVVGAAVLFGWAEWAGAQMSPPTGVGKDLILWAEPLAGEIRLDGILDEPEAARKVLYFAITKASERWTRPVQDWTAALNGFALVFPDRVPA